MSYDPGTSKDHHEISELLPWYLNGTIGEPERQRVGAHLRSCAVCRDELSHERRIHEGMAADTGVEYMPTASLKRLQARLDGAALEPATGAAANEPAVPRPLRGRSMRWRRWAAASVAAAGLVIGLITADRYVEFRARALPAPYYTVTNSEARSPDEVIRAVFSPTITLVELQAILDEAQLRIVSGPTEAGVYSLAANSRRPVSSSLELLRRHPAVRFAETTERSVEPSNATASGKTL